ncbi:MAG TPA: OmpH family outer membrane protein [Candidatus Acidoferrum sp.]|jgi:outer membrane protein|nr:OmpH family outer membrane protein [Candidatus Acidoferrum sp.]
MNMRSFGIGVIALPLVPAIWSQVGSTGAPAPSKVGTISLQAAIVSTAEGKQASAELQTRFAARSTELQNLQKQIKDIQAKLQSSQQVLSEGERGRLQREGERLSGTLQRKQQYFQEDLNAAQQDMMNNIGPKLAEVLSKYSKENGYSVIVDTSSQQTPVVYGAPQVDVTEEITKLYDQSHPAKSTPTTTPKATPHPTKP